MAEVRRFGHFFGHQLKQTACPCRTPCVCYRVLAMPATESPPTNASRICQSRTELVSERLCVPRDNSNFVILPQFEHSTRRPTDDPQLPMLPLVSNRSAAKQEKSPTVPVEQSRHGAALRQFRDVVWKQLMPSEYGCDLSIALFDEAAKQFPPVGRRLPRLWPS